MWPQNNLCTSALIGDKSRITGRIGMAGPVIRLSRILAATKRPTRGAGRRIPDRCCDRLSRIIFDDEMRLHLHRIGHIREQRHASELRSQLRGVDFDVVGHVTLGQRLRFHNQR
jgi:hypothetical protein